jgi:hypothetical protein
MKYPALGVNEKQVHFSSLPSPDLFFAVLRSSLKFVVPEMKRLPVLNWERTPET